MNANPLSVARLLEEGTRRMQRLEESLRSPGLRSVLESASRVQEAGAARGHIARPAFSVVGYPARFGLLTFELDRLAELLETAGAFRLPPEAVELFGAAQAYGEGDEALLRALAERRIGDRPPSFVLARLGKDIGEMRRGGELAVSDVWGLLAEHGRRLAGEGAEREDRRRAEAIYRRWKKNPKLKRALAEYEGPFDTYGRDFRVTEVHRALYARKALRPGEEITPGNVEWRLEYDNRPSHESVDSPRESKEPDPHAYGRALWHTVTARGSAHLTPEQMGKLAPLDNLPELTEFFNDPQALAPYRTIEGEEEDPPEVKLDKLIVRAGLPPRELEVVKLMLSEPTTLKGIADRLGIADSTARGLWKKARRKLSEAG